MVREEEERDCLVPFQADANEPHQPLTSVPEKQAGHAMSCHCSLQGQPMDPEVSANTHWLVGAAEEGAMLGAEGPRKGQGTQKSPSLVSSRPAGPLGSFASHRL